MATVTAPSVGGWRERKRKRERNTRITAFIALTLGAIMFAAPFLFMLSISFKNPAQADKMAVFELPKPFYPANYGLALAQMNFMLELRNTCVIVFANVVGILCASAMVAYGFARLPFPGKNVWFAIMLSTMMLPPFATLLPLYAKFKDIGWVNTFLPLTVPAYCGSAYMIFLLRQFFMSLPGELEDAARIDGCHRFDIFWRIFLPLSKPALITVGIFTFMGSWNNLFGPLVYLRTPNMYTLSVGLAQFNGLYSTEYGRLMAASIVIVSPLLLLFFVAQKYFVKGIVLSGLGGR
ncbi:MAG TPA: carbohydrate ABC transporter permease [Armatimonadota bacterium]|jgi:ABC-type glycerol-3-phosphate transport system permease component